MRSYILLRAPVAKVPEIGMSIKRDSKNVDVLTAKRQNWIVHVAFLPLTVLDL